MDNLLREEIYEKDKCAWFFSKNDPNFALSNMGAGFGINYRGIMWHSSEQLYQASKYTGDVICLPATGKAEEPNVRKRIIASKNARGAKMTQKCAEKAGLVRAEWDRIRIDNMLYVLKLKLKNNSVRFRKALLGTGNREIVELSSKDTFWGAKEVEPGILKGQNVLGKLLMMVRDDMDRIIAEKLVEPVDFMLD